MIVVQRVCDDGRVPDSASLKHWARSALQGEPEVDARDLVIRIVDAGESAELNGRFRGKAGPTNVLSFPFQPDHPFPADEALPLGDIAVCAELVYSEAQEQHKDLAAHWAHLIVHGTLHLLGYDHDEEPQRVRMEAVECRLLADLGFPDPYRDDGVAA